MRIRGIVLLAVVSAGCQSPDLARFLQAMQPREIELVAHAATCSPLTSPSSLPLADALRLADFANPTIGLANEYIRRDEAELTIARALLLPTVNVGATLSLHQGALLSAQGIVRNVERESLYFGAGADVRGAGPVAIPGVILTSHLGDAVFAPQVARQRVLTSSLQAVATRHQVLLQTALAYLSLVGARDNVAALRQSQRDLSEVVKLTDAFAAKGLARAGDADRAHSESLLLESAESAAEEGVALWAAELSRLLSGDPSLPINTETDAAACAELVDTRTSLEALVQDAVARRPEVAARAAAVALYETRLRQERWRPLAPTLAVGVSAGDFGGGSDQAGYRFSHFGGRQDVDVLAYWSLHNLGFGNRAAQNKVRAEIAQAGAQRARTIDMVRREVAEAHSQAIAQQRLLEIAEKRAATAHQAFREDLTRAKNIEGRLVEVLDSFNQLTSARQERVQAASAYRQAQLSLFVAIGNSPLAAIP